MVLYFLSDTCPTKTLNSAAACHVLLLYPGLNYCPPPPPSSPASTRPPFFHLAFNLPPRSLTALLAAVGRKNSGKRTKSE